MTKKRKNLINQDPHYKRELEKYGIQSRAVSSF